MDNKLILWEVRVPTQKPDFFKGKNRFFTRKYHQKWDIKVMAIAGGLTLMSPNYGNWCSPEGQVYRERMIPVQVACTRTQLDTVMALVASHYGQKSVMARKISDEVIIKAFNCTKSE